MKCPNCGYKRQKRDDAFVPATECPSCGIVYSKHEGVTAFSTMTPAASIRPSVVDPESLKKAKDRVEKRLRDRMETPVRDKRHAQTLELSKKLTKNVIRRHRDQEAARQNKKSGDSSIDDPEALSASIESQPEEPLLLKDAIGVRIHDGHNDPIPEKGPRKGPRKGIEEPHVISDETVAAEVEVEEIVAKEIEVEETAAKEIKVEETAAKEVKVEETAAKEIKVEETAAAGTLPEGDKLEPSVNAYTEREAAVESDAIFGEQAPPEVPKTEPASAFPDDVKVETIVLESSEEDDFARSQSASNVDEVNAPDVPPVQETMDVPPAYIAATTPPIGATSIGDGMKRLLPVIAWLILFSGVIGAILSWTTISDVQAGVDIPGPTNTGTVPLGLLLGFAYLATGALGFAFFWVSSLINKQLKDIRRLLMVHPIAMMNDAVEVEKSDASGITRGQ